MTVLSQRISAELNKVPFLVPLLSLLLAIVAFQIGADYLTSIVSILLAVIFIPFISRSSSASQISSFNKYSWPVIALLFFGISLMVLSFHKNRLPDSEVRQPYGMMQGEIMEMKKSLSGMRYTVKIADYRNSKNKVAAPFEILLYTDSLNAGIGDLINLPDAIRWYGETLRYRDDYESMMIRRGVLGDIVVTSGRINVVDSGKVSSLSATRLRENCLRLIDKTALSSDSKMLVKMLLLGDRSDASAELRQQLAYSGMAHIFALSGMHLGIIMTLFLWLLLPLNIFSLSKLRYAITIVLIFGYCYIIGWPLSAVRAAVMASFMLLSLILERPNSSFNALCAAAFFILLWSPPAIGDVSFQLSFFCVLFLIAYRDVLFFIDYKKERVLYRILSFLLSMLVATLGTWVIVAYHFGTFAPAFSLSNILVLPLLPFYLLLAVIILIASLVSLQLPWLISLLNCGTNLILDIASRFGSSPLGVIQFRPHLATVIVWTSGFLLLGWYLSLRSQKELWQMKGHTPMYFRSLLPCAIAFLVLSGASLCFLSSDSEKPYMTFERFGYTPTVKYFCNGGWEEIAIRENAVTAITLHSQKLIFVDNNRYSSISRKALPQPSVPESCSHLVVCNRYRGELSDLFNYFYPSAIIDMRMNVSDIASANKEKMTLPTDIRYYNIGNERKYLLEFPAD